MGRFKDDLPDYKAYHDIEGIYFSSIPSSVWPGFSGLVRRAAPNAQILKSILNGFAGIIPCEPTANWGYDFLINDVAGFISDIREQVEAGRIYKFFDCILLLVQIGKLSADELNEFLEDCHIGYQLYYDLGVKSMKLLLPPSLLLDK